MTTSAQVLIVGAGGHAHAILALIERHGGYVPVGMVDLNTAVEGSAYGLPVLGGESVSLDLCKRKGITNIIVAIGDNYRRQAAMRRLKHQCPESFFPPLIDPSATVAHDAKLSQGVLVMANAHVGAGAVLGAGVLINSASSLDHDSTMEPFSSLAPGVVTGGGIRIGERSSIGLGASLIHRVSVGEDTVVGAGSLVLRDIPPEVVAYGSPARVIRSRQPDELYL